MNIRKIRCGMKKVFFLIIVGVAVLLLPEKVLARQLTIDEVVTKFYETKEYEYFKEKFSPGFNLKLIPNTENKTLDVYASIGENDLEKQWSFKYTDEYIEINNRDYEITAYNWDVFVDTIYTISIYGILEAIISLSGYNIDDIKFNDSNYEKYGLQIEDETYRFTEEDRTSVALTVFIKYLKVSLDTDKIDALALKNGINVEKKDSNNSNNEDNIQSSSNNSPKPTEAVTKDDITNPNTGAFISLGGIYILLLGSLFIIRKIKRKSKFVRV